MPTNRPQRFMPLSSRELQPKTGSSPPPDRSLPPWRIWWEGCRVIKRLKDLVIVAGLYALLLVAVILAAAIWSFALWGGLTLLAGLVPPPQ